MLFSDAPLQKLWISLNIHQELQMKVICFVFMLIAVTTCTSFAQTAGADTAYIKPYPQKMSLRGYEATYSLLLSGAGKTYQPNYPLNPGIGFSIKNTIINAEYDYGLIPLKGAAFGKTKLTDIQLHNYGRHFVLDLFVQKYNGFYTSKTNGQDIVLYPGLSVSQVGAEGSYVFNGDKFSAKAAFAQSEMQLQSAGSFILGGGAYLYEIIPDNNMLIASNGPVNNLQLGFNGGYAHSWVLNDRWLISAMVTAGANFGNDPHLLKDGKIKVYPTAFARSVASYHKPAWAVSMQMLINYKSVSTLQNENFSLAAVDFELSYVRHFDGIFKKKKGGI
jgi:hypothetical protein